MAKRPISDGWFFVLWLYLMVLSIAFAPIIAHFVKQAIATEARR